MTISFGQLVALHGEAGARELFEQMCTALIKREYPDAHGIQVWAGDGGIDAFTGSWLGIITVFQCKFFRGELGKSQRQQIEESYRRARTNRDIVLQRWVLCLGCNLTSKDMTWWEKWRSGKDIDLELWDETKLLTMLYQEKNADIREVFFGERQRAQLQEIYDVVTKHGGTAGLQAREQFEVELEGWSDPFVSNLKQRGYIEAIIRPSTYNRRLARSHTDLESALRYATLRFSPWLLPNWGGSIELRPLKVGSSSISEVWDAGCDLRAWCYFKSGQLVHVHNLYQDWCGDDGYSLSYEEWEVLKPRPLYSDLTLAFVAGIYTMAARLAQTDLYKGLQIDISIRIVGLQGRELRPSSGPGLSVGPCHVDEYVYSEHYSSAELIGGFEEEAITFIEQLFLHFQRKVSREEIRRGLPKWEPAWD